MGSANQRKPLPAGTKIEFCDHEAVVLADPGGDDYLTVEVDGHQARWYWSFEGASCSVLSLPEQQPQA